MWLILLGDGDLTPLYDFMDFNCKELEAVLYVVVVVFIFFEIFLLLKR